MSMAPLYPATLITIAMILAITARRVALALTVERWTPEESLLKLGDEQGGVRVNTGSLSPPSSSGAGAPPPQQQRHPESGGGGWTWVALAIVIIGVAALYVVWRVLHANS
jgi:hypothetical protein